MNCLRRDRHRHRPSRSLRDLASRGRRNEVAVIERNAFGGTCVNLLYEANLGTNPALNLLRPKTRGNPNEIFDLRRSNRCRHAWTGCVPKNRENGDSRATRSSTDSGSRSCARGGSRSNSCSGSSGSSGCAWARRSPWKIRQHRSGRSAAAARRSKEKLAVRHQARVPAFAPAPFFAPACISSERCRYQDRLATRGR